MKLKTAAFVLGPPVVALSGIAIFNLSALTLPMALGVGMVVGIFGAFVQRLLEE